MKSRDTEFCEDSEKVTQNIDNLCFVRVLSILFAGFVQTLQSPGMLLFRIPGLESPGKRHRSFKTKEINGKSWNSKARFWNDLTYVLSSR